VMDAEANCEISIGSEICEHEQIDLPHLNELAFPQSACADEQCLGSSNLIIDREQGNHFDQLKSNFTPLSEFVPY